MLVQVGEGGNLFTVTVEQLSERIPVETVAELTAARVEMVRRVAAAYGVPRDRLRVPRDVVMLFRGDGVPISSVQYVQADWVRARLSGGLGRPPYCVGIAKGYLSFVLGKIQEEG